MIDMETLIKFTSEAAVKEARNAMDLDSVSNLHFNSKGRLEGGVKPAPPSTEKPAYVKITNRGKRYMVDCRIHGKGNWCLHALVLCLHHLGSKPVYRVERTAPQTVSGVGYQIVAEFHASGARIMVRSLSTGHFLNNPLKSQPESCEKLLNPQALELLQDLAECNEHVLEMDRKDLAPFLSAAHQLELHHPNGEAYKWESLKESPKLEVSIRNGAIHWQATPAPSTTGVFAPGWPGYLVEEQVIRRFPGYLPDLQHLDGLSAGSKPLTAENLKPFLDQKHRIEWLTAKPELLRNPEEAGLQFSVDRRDLVGQFGVWRNHEFYALEDLDQPLQLLKGQPLKVLDVSRTLLNRWFKESRSVKCPWRDAGFRIREQGAARFLEEMHEPESWRVMRKNVDEWFGLSHQDMSVSWEGGRPQYQVGESIFDHQTLAGGLSDQQRGVRLADGRLLNIDTAQIRTNDLILKGVQTLHTDIEAQNALISRMMAPKDPVEPPALKPFWDAKLRPYQKEGVQWMLGNHQRNEPCLLADDMGLGKTIQTLAYLDHVRGDLPQLIVAPTSLLQNWARECETFSPHRKVTIHHGPGRTKDAEGLGKADLVITSYGVVRSDLELLYDVEFQVAALDEAQAIKNPSSQTARAVCELWCEHRLALTGTPVENRLLELWSIFQFLAPGYLGDEEQWRALSIPGSATFQAIKAQTGPFMKRRLKTEVEPDLPARQEITVSLPMQRSQMDLYTTYLRGARAEAQSDNALSILTKLLRLRQICCHPGLVDDLRIGEDSNKLAFLMEQLEEVTAEGHAALVFSQFTSLLQRVRFELEEKDMPCFYLDGKTRNRSELVDRFQNGERPVFLISLKAGGTGLTLTKASYVYHLDPWWNPMVEAQATDRAHRIGQTQKVFSYKLVSEGTVEEKILKLQARKKLLARGLWDEEVLEKLDRDTLLELLT